MEKYLAQIIGTMSSIESDIFYLMPEIILVFSFLMLIVIDILNIQNKIRWIIDVTVLGLIFCGLSSGTQFWYLSRDYVVLFSDTVAVNSITAGYKILIDISALVVIVLSFSDDLLFQSEKGRSEFYILLTASVLGLHLMLMAQHLLMVYLSIEFVSVLSYVLAAYTTQNKFSEEAGMKYALFGGTASAVMLYGISLLYGLTGTLHLFDVQFYQGLATSEYLAVIPVLLLIVTGLLFKISAFPMHVWVADVYQGAPTTVSAFLSVLPKVGGVVLLITFIFAVNNAYPSSSAFMAVTESGMAVLAILTMTIGNLSALHQGNVKRILAYSAVAQAGFILVGIEAYTVIDPGFIWYYLVVSSIAGLGGFAGVLYLSGVLKSEELKNYSGQGKQHRLVSVAMLVFMASLIGLPPTAGFVGKFFILSSAAETYILGDNPLVLAMVIIAVINTVISLFYYIKIPLYLFIKKSEMDYVSAPQQKVSLKVLIAILALLTLLLGIFPQTIMNLI